MVLIAFTMGLGAVKETTRSAASPPSPVSNLGARLFPTAETSPTPAAIPTVEELEEPEVPEEKPPPKEPEVPEEKLPLKEPEEEMATIQCPGCSAQITVPKLAKLQKITCDSCGVSGEIEI